MPEFLLRLVRLVWLFARGQQAFVLEHRAPPTMGSLQTSSQVSTLKSLRSSVLDRACKVLGELATSTNHRPSRHCRAWAETVFSPALGAFVVRAGENDWPSASKQADPRADSDHSWRESLWRAPRIHGELLKLAIEVSERTVSRILHTFKRTPSQTWGDFLTEPYRGDRCGQFLHRADGQTAGAVRVPCSGTSP